LSPQFPFFCKKLQKIIFAQIQKLGLIFWARLMLETIQTAVTISKLKITRNDNIEEFLKSWG